jgi:crossover junction endodeoxyribonuclease RuvC
MFVIIVFMNERKSIVILGVDPGLANTGWGVIELAGSKMRPLDYGAITTSATADITSRLKWIHDMICGVVEKFSPDEAAVESVFFAANVKSAMATGQARGAALVALGLNNILVNEYTPLQIKQSIVGYGRAEKQQMQFLVKALLSMKETPSPDHAADALGAAICHANYRGHKRLEAAMGGI